jgi:hypothetical protein
MENVAAAEISEENETESVAASKIIERDPGD